ncbi:MAG: hypothetical protein JSW37_12765 [Anaerolineales bacterium]|nr:MAG: hypothetical protein JSW37_12765 [Anaerolineales bacterium]
MNRARFAIKYNMVVADASCELCGETIEPNVGSEPFLDGACGPVCWHYGHRYASELAAMLEALRAFDGMGAVCHPVPPGVEVETWEVPA